MAVTGFVSPDQRHGRPRPLPGNALNHGLYAREALASGEDVAGFAELGSQLQQALAPEGAIEEALRARVRPRSARPESSVGRT